MEQKVLMQSGSKSKCASASHQLLLENAKNRLSDLQDRFANLRAARKEGRPNDVAVLEEQVYQILREWNSELTAPSPASSLLVCIYNSSTLAIFVFNFHCLLEKRYLQLLLKSKRLCFVHWMK